MRPQSREHATLNFGWAGMATTASDDSSATQQSGLCLALLVDPRGYRGDTGTRCDPAVALALNGRPIAAERDPNMQRAGQSSAVRMACSLAS